MGSGISCKTEIEVMAPSPKGTRSERSPPAKPHPGTAAGRSPGEQAVSTIGTSVGSVQPSGPSGPSGSGCSRTETASGGPASGPAAAATAKPTVTTDSNAKDADGSMMSRQDFTKPAAGCSSANGSSAGDSSTTDVGNNARVQGSASSYSADTAAVPAVDTTTWVGGGDGDSCCGTDVASPATAAATAASTGLRLLPHIGGLAVSLAFLIDFAERYVEPLQPTWAVVEQLIKPHTLQSTIRYVDLPDVFRHTLPPGRTDYYFVSHAWGRPFWEMVGLCAHYLRGAVAEDTYVWCDIFIINQHPGRQQADDLQQLQLAVRDATAVLVCTDAAGAPFERIWCLFEMWTAICRDVCDATTQAGEREGHGSGRGGSCNGEEGLPACSSDPVRGDSGGDGDGSNRGISNGGGGLVRSRSQALVVLTTGLSASQRARLYSQIDAGTARATIPSDKERILADIATSPGGITAFNAAMRCALLLRPLDYEGELSGLTEMMTSVTHGSVRTGTPAVAADGRTVQPQDWDFHPADSWLALPPAHRHHRALALLGGPGTGKSSAAAAVMKHLMGVGEPRTARRRTGDGRGNGIPVVAHFCRASNLQALDPLAAMRTMAYQLSLLFPDHLQGYYAFDLTKSPKGHDGHDHDSGGSFALEAIAGMAAAEGAIGAAAGGSGGDVGSGSGQDPVAAAFDALLLRPLELLWKSYEDAVQATADGGSGATAREDAGGGIVAAAAAASEAMSCTAAVAPPPSPPSPPQLVILLDAVDEGESGGAGGSHENAMLLLLQEHFPRLPAFVRLIVTARPLPYIRAILVHKFDPWFISPDNLRPPVPACISALAARLARRPALMALLQQGGPGTAATASAAAGSDDSRGNIGVKALADRLWEASRGWMLFLRLAGDILEGAAAKATAPALLQPTAVASVPPQSTPSLSLIPTQVSILDELEAAAAAAAEPALYSLYFRVLLGAPTAGGLDGPAPAPAPAAATGGSNSGRDAGGGRSAAGVVETGPRTPTAGQLAFLLEVLGAAREPLYLSQLQDLGLPAISSGDGRAPTAGASTSLRLGCLVNVRGYKLYGIHRSLLEWLADGGADEVRRILGGDAVNAVVDADAVKMTEMAVTRSAGGGGGGLRRGHAALAAMTLRDIAAARATTQAANNSGGIGSAARGGARGPRGPDVYSLQHAVAHVLEAAAAMTAAGEEGGALTLLRTLLLDFYYWRCVYQDGSAASVALAALLRHETVFSAAHPATTAMAKPSPPVALAAEASRWLQSYHGSLLRFPEAILQSALALPSSSPIRAAALVALAPQRPLLSSDTSRPVPASPTGPGHPTYVTASLQPVSASGVDILAGTNITNTNNTEPPQILPPASTSGTVPPSSITSCSPPSSDCAPVVTAPTAIAQLEGTSWPKAFLLGNPAPDWDACLLAVESRGVTRGLAWVPEPGLVLTACDDRKLHQLSPITGSQVGLMEGHTDRVYCVALRPQTKTRSTQLHEPELRDRGSTHDPDLDALGEGQTASAAATAAATAVMEPEAVQAGHPSAAAGVVVASGSLDGHVALWDGATRVQLQLLEPGEDRRIHASGDQDDGGCRPAVTSFGFSVSEDRPAGPSAIGSVDCLAFSPDGGLLAAGTSDGSITVWRVMDGDSTTTNDDDDNDDDDGGPSSSATAPVSAAATRAVKAWVAPQAHTAAVQGLTFLELPQSGGAGTGANTGGGGSDWSSTGGGGLTALVLVSCSEDGCIHVWDPRVVGGTADGRGVAVVSEPLRTLRADSEPQKPHSDYGESSGAQYDILEGVAEDTDVQQSRASYRAPEHYCLAAGPGLPAGYLLAGSGSGPVVVWDVVTGRLRERLRGHVEAVRCLALQHGGPHFASGSGDCTVRLWRHLPTADPQGWLAGLQAARQRAQEDAVPTAAATTATGGVHGAQELEAPEEDPPAAPDRVCRRPCQWQCVGVLRGHTRLVTSLTFLATAAAPGSAEPRPTSALLGSRPTGSKSESVAEIQAKSRSGFRGNLSAALRPVSRLASASVDFTVRIWQVDPAAAPPGLQLPGGDPERPVGHDGFSVNTVAVSPDGRLIATGADDFQVCIWDGASGVHRRTLRCFYGRVRAVSFSRDSKLMVAAAEDGGVLIFTIDEGGEFSNIGWCRGHTKAATGVAFSPDGFSVATSSEDGTARIWSVRGFQTALLEGHPAGATAVAWAEEGSLVATGAARGNPGVQLWDARMGMRLNTYRYHTADVAVLAFGSCTEAPQPPSTSSSGLPMPAPPTPEEEPNEQQPQARRHVLLMSVDVRGLACVWDVWGGGLLHYIANVQGADLAGSKLLWLQARAMHYADMQELLQRRRQNQRDKQDDDTVSTRGHGGSGGAAGGRQHWRLRSAVAALYPSGEAVDVVAAGKGLSCVAVVTDKQRLYIFRPVE